MKKIFFMFALALAFSSSVAFADTVDCTTTPGACANGPIVAQISGGRFLKAGQEDCPWWFPSNFGHACYTMRPLGAFFIPLN